MKQKVCIVGAGISGIYLAYLLEDKFDVTILEARDRLGGRIHSKNGHDLGPSWVWSHQQHILELIEELDLELFRQYSDGYALYDAHEGVQKFNPQPSMPSFRIKGSLTHLIDSLQQKLKNTKILTSQVVVSITENDSGIVVKSNTDSYNADYVVNTLAPRLALSLEYKPALPILLKEKMQHTHTWMGNSMKCVIEFEKPFWKEQGHSGFMFSNRGPIGEMHDACIDGKSALFGFVHSNASLENFEDDVKEQLVRVFGISQDEILDIHYVDWKEEKFTSTAYDKKTLSAHPAYGIDTSAYSDKIYFSATEFSFKEGGYIEGAIINAQVVAKQIINMYV